MCRCSGKYIFLKDFTNGSRFFISRSLIKLVFVLFGLLLASGQSIAGPADNIVQMTAAQFGTPKPDSVNLPSGSSKVASRTGAFEYSYVIEVPPGRLGMQPSLALNYSSQNPIYGGLAAGWQFTIPEIKVDHSRSTKLSDHGEDNRRWISSLAGGHRLVPVEELSEKPSYGELGSYRAIYDDSYARYERFTDDGFKQWRVRNLDGSVFGFGEADGHIVAQGSDIQVLPKMLSNDRAPLTHTEDRFGNRVDYYYSVRWQGNGGFAQSIRLERIEYTKNPAVIVDGIDHHAEIRFRYGDTSESNCGGVPLIPTGASLSHRAEGFWVSGSDRLDEITAYVHSGSDYTAVRKYELDYTERCSNFAGATRFLTSIVQSAPASIESPTSAWISLPPVTFDYGDPEPKYDSNVDMSISSHMGFGHGNSGHGSIFNALEWGVRVSPGDLPSQFIQEKHTIQAKLIDLDGDGILDRIQSDFLGQDSPRCGFRWEPGSILPGSTGDPKYQINVSDSRSQIVPLPTIGSWLGKYWVSDREYCSLTGHVNFAWNIEAGFSNSSCPDPTHIGNQLAYRFMDMDSDGRPDLVTALSYDGGYFDPGDYTDHDPFGDAFSDPKVDAIHPVGAFIKPWEIDKDKSIYCSRGDNCQFNDSVMVSKLRKLSAGDGMWPGSWDYEANCDFLNGGSGCVSFKEQKDSGGSGLCEDAECCESARSDLMFGTSCDLPTNCIRPSNDRVHNDCGGNLEPCVTGVCLGGNGGSGGDNGGDSGGGGFGELDCDALKIARPRSSYGEPSTNILKWYRNEGPENGFFDLNSPRVTLSPIPLDMDSGTGPVQLTVGAFTKGRLGSGPIGRRGAFIDINGDGYLDTVKPGAGLWQVHLGDGQGHFNEDPATNAPYMWFVPPLSNGALSRPSDSITNTSSEQTPNGLLWRHRTFTTQMLADMNADGLVDLLRFDEKNQLSSLHHNTGTGFSYFNFQSSNALTVRRDSSLPGNPYVPIPVPPNVSAGRIGSHATNAPPHKTTFRTLSSKSLIRLVDWDNDGRLDIVANHNFEVLEKLNLGGVTVNLPPNQPIDHEALFKQLYLNDGTAPLLLRSGLTPSDAKIVALESEADKRWWISSDFIDVTGDGIAERVAYDRNNLSVTGIDLSEGVPRLLKSIDNGRGLIRKITYKAHNDPRVSATSQIQNVLMPQPIWVVEEVKYLDFIGDQISVSEAKYGDPIWNQENHPTWNASEPGKYGFRGFTTIEISAPHEEGAATGFSVIEEKYGYDVDWSGRLVGNLLYIDGFPSGDGTDATVSISTTNWIERAIMDGKSLSYARSQEYTRACETVDGGFKSEDLCEISPITDETIIWNDYYRNHQGTGPFVASLVRQVWQSPTGFYSHNKKGSILNKNIYKLFSDEDQYHLMTTENITSQGNGSTQVLVAKITRTPDAAGKFFENESVYVENDPTTALLTSFQSDADTGHLTSRRKPEQHPGPLEIYGFTGFLIQPSSITNELQRITATETDLMTGQRTVTHTPNTITCADDSSGPAGIKSNYDGFGRPIEISKFGCKTMGTGLNQTNTYSPIPIKRFEYIDVGSTGPRIIKEYTLVNQEANQWTEVESFYDGFGRVISVSESLGNGNARTTNYNYDARGNLVGYDVPRPNGSSDSDRSTYAYRYDVLGRPVGMRVPDSSDNAPNPSDVAAWNAAVGTNISYGYDGVHQITTTNENVGDSGPAGETKTYQDSFGRLVKVEELMSSGSFATTIYGYDGNDNLKHIRDADGVETFMEHDWASRRNKIIREGRVWKYGYDNNGNLTTVTTPNDSDDVNYVSSIAYDVLDRPKQNTIAHRGLRTAQLADYDSELVTYEYDDGPNAIGRLSAVFVGGSPSPSLIKTFTYNWDGQISEATQQVNMPDSVATNFPTITRTNYFEYDGAGLVTDAWLADGGDNNTKANSTHLRYGYDTLGRPDTLSWDNGLAVLTQLADMSRNHAGLLTSQASNHIQRDWDYDHLGRVTRDQVKCQSTGGAGACQPGAIQFFENAAYYDSNEVGVLSVGRNVPGWVQHNFEFEYDDQHQLVSAMDIKADNNVPYSVAWGYTPGGLFTFVGPRAPLSDPVGREAYEYTYGTGLLVGADEHAVTELNGANGDVKYFYDFSGNMTTRKQNIVGGSTLNVEYDGSSQQREVNLSGGGRELYYYDEGGSRYMAVLFDGAGTLERARVWNGGVETWFDAGGNVISDWAHIGLGAQSIGRIDDQSKFELSFHNGLQHLMGSIDFDTGNINTAFVYGPYGEVIEQTADAETDLHRRRFNGKGADQISKLNYYGFRYYDPLSLQWTQADPLYRVVPDLAEANPRRMTLYAFSLNNPVRYLDPDGRDPTFNPSISAEDRRALNRLYQSRDRQGYMKKTIEAYKINASALANGRLRIQNGSNISNGYALRGSTEQEWQVPAIFHSSVPVVVMRAERNFFTSGTIDAVITTLHEAGHIEFNELVGNWDTGDGARALASEMWAYAVGIRGAEQLFAAGEISQNELEQQRIAQRKKIRGHIRRASKADRERARELYDEAHETQERRGTRPQN